MKSARTKQSKLWEVGRSRELGSLQSGFAIAPSIVATRRVSYVELLTEILNPQSREWLVDNVEQLWDE